MPQHDPYAAAAKLLAFYQRVSERAGVSFAFLEDDGDPADAMTATQDGSHMTLRINAPLDPWFGVTSKDVTAKIDDARPDSLLVQVTSPGGIAFEGLNIYSALASYKRGGMEINSEAQGLVASAAVLPFLAGDKREINEGSLIMVHEPFGGMFAFGTAKEIEAEATKTVNALNAIDGEYGNVVAKRTGTSASQTRQWLDEEKWFNSQQAVESGFAHEAVDGQSDEPDDEAMQRVRAVQAHFLLGVHLGEPR